MKENHLNNIDDNLQKLNTVFQFYCTNETTYLLELLYKKIN